MTALILTLLFVVATTPRDKMSTEALPMSGQSAGNLLFGQTTLSADQLDTKNGPLYDVKVTGDEIAITDQESKAGKLKVEVRVPYQTLGSYFPGKSTVDHESDDKVTVKTTLPVFGRDLTVNATCKFKAEDGLLAITPVKIDSGAPNWLEKPVLALVENQFTIRRGIDGLPEGLEITEASAAEDGLSISLAGENVVLVPENKPTTATSTG